MRALAFLSMLFCLPHLGWAQHRLPRSHAHNDYVHERPLSDALDHGFVSIEADIHLLGDTLYIAHDPKDIQPGRTLDRLYLAPLWARTEQGTRPIYADGPALLLLIDIKTDADATYRALRPLLKAYAPMLTHYTDSTTSPGAVSVVLSGNRPRGLLSAEPNRLAAYDGRLTDLEADPPLSPHFMPLVSQNWSAVARWYGGRTALSEAARKRLDSLVVIAHERGYRLRFWGTGDNEAVWQVLYDAGVDYLNADTLSRLQHFLRKQPEK